MLVKKMVTKLCMFAQTIATSSPVRCNIFTPISLLTHRNYSLLSNTKFKRVNFAYNSILPNNHLCEAMFSNKSNDSPNIMTTTYEVVKDLSNHPETYLIDVREADEIQETGKIPNSIHIPLSEVTAALLDSTSNEVFKKRFGKEKPDPQHSSLIFYCRSGARSHKACVSAVTLEYKNVQNYVGSWLEWSEKEGLSK